MTKDYDVLSGTSAPFNQRKSVENHGVINSMSRDKRRETSREQELLGFVETILIITLTDFLSIYFALH